MLTLSKKIREALEKEGTKKAGVRVTATPPGARASSVALKATIKD